MRLRTSTNIEVYGRTSRDSFEGADRVCVGALRSGLMSLARFAFQACSFKHDVVTGNSVRNAAVRQTGSRGWRVLHNGAIEARESGRDKILGNGVSRENDVDRERHQGRATLHQKAWLGLVCWLYAAERDRQIWAEFLVLRLGSGQMNRPD